MKKGRPYRRPSARRMTGYFAFFGAGFFGASGFVY